MQITDVTVEIHEKRNHPYEFGHGDAMVRITATLGCEEGVYDVIKRLRDLAREQVQAELDGWIAGIEEERRIERLVVGLGQLINDVAQDYYALRAAKAAVRSIRERPEASMQGKYRAKLRKALAKRQERLAALEEKRRQAGDLLEVGENG
jgi:hypothetical protein